MSTEEITPTITPPVEPTPPAPPAEELISKEVADRYKADMFKYKTKVQELEEQLDKNKIQSLKNSKNWQEVAELKEKEAKEAADKLNRMSQALIDDKKYSALKQEAMKMGINPSALPDLELLDFAEINIETTSQGKIIVHGADRAIQNLKMLRPHWFQSKPATINPQSPETLQPVSGAVTVADLEKLQADYRKNPSPATEKAYREAILKFKKQ